jgi:CBS domain-containing protein
VSCPACGFQNLPGDDVCTNCGATLAGTDTAETSAASRSVLLGSRLGSLTIGPATTIDSAVPVGGALNTMHEQGLDCLLVMSGGRLVGIFTERDAVLKLADRRLSIGAIRRRVTRVIRHAHLGPRTLVAEVMTADPVVLQADETVAVAIHKMAVGGFRHIPVLDGERPVGVIAASNIFRHIVELTSA